MSNIKDIEDAVCKLTPDELAVFRSWFARFDAEAWDQQLEQDVASGKLDSLAEDALRDAQQGRCTDL